MRLHAFTSWHLNPHSGAFILGRTLTFADRPPRKVLPWGVSV